MQGDGSPAHRPDPLRPTGIPACRTRCIIREPCSSAGGAGDTERDIDMAFASLVDMRADAEGLVQSFNRPGGNLTGVTTSYDEVAPKRSGLLREILPKAAIIGVLVNPDDPITASSETNLMRTAARSVGQRIEILQASRTKSVASEASRSA